MVSTDPQHQRQQQPCDTNTSEQALPAQSSCALAPIQQTFPILSFHVLLSYPVAGHKNVSGKKNTAQLVVERTWQCMQNTAMIHKTPSSLTAAAPCKASVQCTKAGGLRVHRESDTHPNTVNSMHH
jgi:hypothetical protein